jgi:hypothetical protein
MLNGPSADVALFAAKALAVKVCGLVERSSFTGIGRAASLIFFFLLVQTALVSLGDGRCANLLV